MRCFRVWSKLRHFRDMRCFDRFGSQWEPERARGIRGTGVVREAPVLHDNGNC